MLKKQIGYLVLYISGVFFLITASINIFSYLFLRIFDILGYGINVAKYSESTTYAILIRGLPDMLLLTASIIFVIICKRISLNELLKRISRLSVGLLLLVSFTYRLLGSLFDQLSSYFNMRDVLNEINAEISRIFINTAIVNIPIEVSYLAGAITGVILVVRNFNWISKNSGEIQQWFT